MCTFNFLKFTANKTRVSQDVVFLCSDGVGLFVVADSPLKALPTSLSLVCRCDSVSRFNLNLSLLLRRGDFSAADLECLKKSIVRFSIITFKVNKSTYFHNCVMH